MLPSKRGADDLTRVSTDSLIPGLLVLSFLFMFFFLVSEPSQRLALCSLTCFLFWDNQGFWSELSREVASKLSRSVVSIALCHGDYAVVHLIFKIYA
jgi:hypothetical protein